MQIEQFEKTYENFNGNAYVKEFYLQLNDELKFNLDFLHEAYSKLNPKDKLRLLEVGGGPTIYQLISASLVVDEIVFSDYVENNHLEIKKWIKGDPNIFDWREYFKYVVNLNRDKINNLDIKKVQNLLKSKIKKITYCNVYNENPLHPLNEQPFDIISTQFCLESITNNEEDFLLGLKNISNLLKKNGLLIMGMLKDVDFYKVGNLKYHVFPISEEYMKDKLKKLSYSNIETYTFNGTELSFGKKDGDVGVLYLVATKK